MSTRNSDTTRAAAQPSTSGSKAGLRLLWPQTSLDACDAAEELVANSGKRVDMPLRKTFVRSRDDGATVAPLSQLYSGGRSGIVAIKLYVALIWRCASPPYSTDKPARAWATLLDLDDPAGRGSRRVRSALQALARAKLVVLTEQDGYPNLVTLADESGNGAEYQPPSTAFTFARTDTARTANMYLKIAPKLWTSGFFQSLSGPATVMLLILLAEQADDPTKRVWFSTQQFPQRYAISHKTRAIGTKELVGRGLLHVERESVSRLNHKTFDTRRMRNIYRLTAEASTRAE